MTIRYVKTQSESGFTLIEAVMVIVITGILAGIVAVFIARPVQGYTDTVRRAMLADTADVALRRMVRDVRLALPNSLRLKDSVGTVGSCSAAAGVTCYIEFMPTVAGGRYRDYGDGSSSGNFLDFGNASAKTFDVLGPMVSPLSGGDYVVVYNLGTSYTPADAYTGGNRATVAANGVSGNAVTLTTNVFALESPPLPSPNSRFQILAGSNPVVTYACTSSGSGNSLVRYWGYSIPGTTQPTPPAGGLSAVAAANATCIVNYQSGALRNGLLSVQLTVADPPSGEQVTVFQQIHVDNSP